MAAVVLAGLTVGRLNAQALPTAYQPFRLYGYGAFGPATTDYYAGHSGTGLLLGGVVSVRVRNNLDVGLDARLTRLHNETITETALSGSPRVSYQYQFLQPYVQYGIGYGHAGFPESKSSYTSDSSAVRGLAAGVNVDVNHHWSAFGEYTDQRWRLDDRGIVFKPHMVSFGLRYEFQTSGGTGL